MSPLLPPEGPSYVVRRRSNFVADWRKIRHLLVVHLNKDRFMKAQFKRLLPTLSGIQEKAPSVTSDCCSAPSSPRQEMPDPADWEKPFRQQPMDMADFSLESREFFKKPAVWPPDMSKTSPRSRKEAESLRAAEKVVLARFGDRQAIPGLLDERLENLAEKEKRGQS
jgi:hypothetical protein